MRKIFLLIVFILSKSVFPQDIAIGEWKDHLCYKNALSVAEGNSKVYCGTKGGVFVLNKNDNSIERLTKVNGLSDVEPHMLNFNTYNNKLIIAYNNANIDIVDGKTIYNISDIKRKSIIGNKLINNIYFINQFAYLACGFGIVIIDMNKIEVSDTYYIGPNGSPLDVKDITSDGTNLFASTASGVYTASLSNPNLANFTSWTKMTGLPNGIYNTITVFNGKIYTNISKTGYHNDTVFVYDYSNWTIFSQLPIGYTNKELKAMNNNLLVVGDGSVQVYDQNLVPSYYINSYAGSYLISNQAILDNSGCLWVTDDRFGLLKKINSGAATVSYYPNGPSSLNVSAISVEESSLWVAPGIINAGYHSYYYQDGLYHYHDGEWTNPKGA